MFFLKCPICVRYVSDMSEKQKTTNKQKGLHLTAVLQDGGSSEYQYL